MCLRPLTSRFGSPLVLGRVHWVRPELVAEVRYLTWTDDNLLRQVIYQGLHEDKAPTDVIARCVPRDHPKLRRQRLPLVAERRGGGSYAISRTSGGPLPASR
jgi:ATP-dependent DNA ligase